MFSLSREWRVLPEEHRRIIEGAQAGVPVRLSVIAAGLGIPVLAATLPPGVSGEIRPDEAAASGYLVRVSRHEPKVRQRFTVAHEIAHFLLHRDLIGKGIRDDVLYRSKTLSDATEAEANRLAADILMPHHLLQRIIAERQALGLPTESNDLAMVFEVSDAAMRIRLGLD